MVVKRSPFGDDFVRVELHHSGDWQDITSDVDQEGLAVAHGARSEGGQAEVSTLGFTVRNGDGRYSARNPNSPLYGLIGRNTPARASAAIGARFLDLSEPGARATTPDATDYAPTTAMIIEWEGYRDSWTIDPADLIAKFDPDGDQRSWLLRAEITGHLTLFWYADGVTLESATSPSPLPHWAGHIAIRIRVNLDENGSTTARFYWAPTIAGDWIYLGGIGQPGPSSFYNSTAPLTIGKVPGSAAATPPQHVYGWAIRTFDTETVLASSTLATAHESTTTFTDDQARTWTLHNAATITNRRIIAAGEVSEWPMEWELKGAETVLSSVVASGITRRLGQGAAPLHSVLHRALAALGPETIGYWPMEESDEATTFAPAIGSRTAQIDGRVDPAAYEDFAGSEPLPKLGSGRIRLFTDVYEPSDEAQVRWVGRVDPADVTADEQHYVRVYLTGKFARIDVRLWSGGFSVYAFDDDGNSRGFFTHSADMSSNMRMSIELTQVGDHVKLAFALLPAGATVGGVGQVEVQDVGPLGRITQVIFNPGRTPYAETPVGHVTVENEVTGLFDVSGSAMVGYDGEQTPRRIGRLTSNQGIKFTARGGSGPDAQNGPEQLGALLDLMREAAATDGGMLHDDPTGIGLRYRTHASLYSQAPITIPYEDNLVIPFEPVDDDALTRNRITVKRDGGGDFTVEQATGPMSVLPPPDGVGLYDESLTRNLHTDLQAIDHARWRLHIGTWDEGRYPTLGVDLAHPTLLADPVLTRDLLALTPGDRLVITDPPPWLPPTSVDVIVTGIRITVTPLHVLLQWTCIPARPYRAAYWSSGHRWSAGDTVLTSTVSDTRTNVIISSPSNRAWTDVDGEYLIDVEGEHMNVRAASRLTNRLTTTSFEHPSGFTSNGDCTVESIEWTIGGGMPTDGTHVAGVTMGAAPSTATGVWVDLDGAVAGGQHVGVALDVRGSGTTAVPRVRILIAAWDASDAQVMDERSDYFITADYTVKRIDFAATLPATAVRAAVLLIGAGETTDIPPAGSTLITDSWIAFVRGGTLTGTGTLARLAGYWTRDAYDMLVDRSINGVVRAHDAGEAVALAEPSYYGRTT